MQYFKVVLQPKKIILVFFGFQNYVNTNWPKFLILILKGHLFILTGIFLFIGPPLLTLKSWESWVEEKMTSKTR